MNPEHAFSALLSAIKNDLKHELLNELRSELSPSADRRLEEKEAAEYLGISPETLARIRRERQIEHISIGVSGSRRPRVLYSLHTLDAWLRKKEVESIAR